MKKLAFIFFVTIHLQSSCQRIVTSTTANCDDKLYMTLNGKWKQDQDLRGSEGFSKTDQMEAFKRLDAIHQLVYEAYPEPIGLDAVWHRTQISNELFAQEKKYIKEPEGRLRDNLIKGTAIGKYTYTAGFFKYYCFNDSPKREVRVSSETGTWLYVKANQLWAVADGIGSDTMTIGGRPVFLLQPVREIWKGHINFNLGQDTISRIILIHRKDMSPYIPVTRRQYLAHCIKHVPEMIIEMSEGLSITGDVERAEKMKKMAGTAIKRYQDKLEKTIKANLLDSPAVVFQLHPLVEDELLPIFSTIKEGGRMMVTENPAYFRKDLPKYVPQLFVLFWGYEFGTATENVSKRIEEYFPNEKLQAMIDK